MIEARLSLQRPGFALDVALDLPAQGASALFGPSGCGKTTVLRALAGLEPVRGRVVVEGEVWQDDAQGIFVPPHRRAVGYVIQESALFPHLSVAGNLDYGRRRSGGDAARLATLVQLLDIGPLMGRRPDTLSGGERQRVAIARALATGPRLLLMDEPMAALDAARKAELLPYLQRLQAESRVPLVYVSHAFDEVAQLADHLVLMAAGCVQAAGPLTELTARLDLPLAQSDAAGVVLEATLAGRDETWHLARLDVGPGDFELWARDPGCPAGRRLRARLLARDLSLTRAPQAGSSIGNQVAGVVDGIGDDAHPALALVRVRIGRAHVLARLTRRSVHALALAPGEAVWVQVKTVALLE